MPPAVPARRPVVITGFMLLPQPYLDQMFSGRFATAARRKRIARRRGDTWTD